MLVDLHAHYPMHLYPEARTRVGRRVRRSRSIFRLVRQQQAWFRALLVGLASLFINYRSIISGPRVRMSYMREGDVGVALSVLYSFFDEVDVIDGVVPKRHYIDALIEQMDVVEDNIADHHTDVAEVTPNPEKLADARGAGKTAVVHCVEGGFHLGGDADQVRKAVGAACRARSRLHNPRPPDLARRRDRRARAAVHERGSVPRVASPAR